ncbi:hypothetical protein BKA93DRAFT_849857 [Sparassis latifolia]
MPVAVSTGYYRFTDIFFEWPVLPEPKDISPLKALLAYDALVHPDHPLRKAGIDGIELFLGTFPNGEMRLLFSSTQIEYIRYWLHAMRLTDAPLPIPASDYLLQSSDLTNCSPCVYRDAASLKKAIRTIEKNNRRMKGTTTLLAARRLAFEKVRTLWAARAGTWLALDFEAWDRDHTVLTEFGWSLVRWDDQHEHEQLAQRGHLVVKEHRGYTNTYVPERRDYYNFGQSEEVSKQAFKERICALVDEHSARGPLFLVFHDNSQDIKYLRSDALRAVSELEFILPDAPPARGVFVVDTADLFAALEGESSANRRALERVCIHLQIKTESLHNAGNDAHYTLLAMQSMAAGDPVDVQREKRWPNRTTSTDPKVAFEPWEEDSDYDDFEGLMPPGVPVAPAEAEVDADADASGDANGEGTNFWQ